VHYYRGRAKNPLSKQQMVLPKTEANKTTRELTLGWFLLFWFTQRPKEIIHTSLE